MTAGTSTGISLKAMITSRFNSTCFKGEEVKGKNETKKSKGKKKKSK